MLWNPNTQDDSATPPHPEENSLQIEPTDRQEDNPWDDVEKNGPVQETEPAPQTQVDHFFLLTFLLHCNNLESKKEMLILDGWSPIRGTLRILSGTERRKAGWNDPSWFSEA